MGLVGDLVARLTLDKTGFSKGLNNADGEAKKFQSSSGKTFDAIKKAAVIAFTAVATSIIAVGTASLKAAADFEKQQVAFEVLLGSAGKAQTLLESIEQFAATTPFQMPGLIEGSKRLLAFGIAEGQVIEKMKNLGNAAMGNQEALTRLIDAYGKLRAKGKASMEELNRFTEAGVPIVQALADQYGVATSELLDMVSKGKVSFDDVDKALTGLTTGTGKFAGMIEKQATTLGGLFSTLKDNIGLVAKDIGMELAPAAKEALGGAIDWIGKNRETIVAAFRAIPELAMETFRTVGKIIETTFSWETLSGVFSSLITGMVNQFAIAWEYFPQIAVKAIDVLNAPFKAIGEYLESVFDTAWANIKNVGIDALQGLVGPINDIISALNTITGAAPGTNIINFDFLKDEIPKVKDFGETWNQAMKEAGQNISDIADLTVKYATETVSNYSTMFSDIGALYGDDVEAYLEAVNKIVAAEKQKMQDTKQEREELSNDEIEIVKEKTQEEIELERKKTDMLLELYGTNEEQFIESINRKADEYEKILGDEFDAAKWTADQITEYRKQKENEASEYAKKKFKERMQIVQSATNFMMGVFGAYFDMQESAIDANVKDEKKAALAKAKLARKEFNYNKFATVVQIGISTAEAAIKAFAMLGPIAGAVAAGIIGGLGATQAAFVIAQKPPPLPKYNRGGKVEGMSGIDTNIARVSNGEYIINSRDAARNMDVLENINSGGSGVTVTMNPTTINIMTADGRIIGRADLEYIKEQSRLGGIIIHPRAIKAIV